MGRGPIRRSESHLGASGGTRLLRRAWLPPHPERALLVVHGLGEHSGRYDHLGAWFAARGVAVHGYDQRGHGRSLGPPEHVERFEELLDDLETVLGLVRHDHPGLPVALMGHGMGALAVSILLRERQPPVHAAVLSGVPPAVPGHRLKASALRVLRSLAPRLRVSSGLDPDALSRDPEVARRYLEDPLVRHRVTSSLAAELLSALGRAQSAPAPVRVPVLRLHGGSDPVCPGAGSQVLHGGPGGAGSATRSYARLRHEIFNEPEQEQVFQDVLEWLRSGSEAGHGDAG